MPSGEAQLKVGRRSAASEPLRLETPRQPRSALRGVVIEAQDEPAPRLRRLITGWVGLVRRAPNGRRQILRLHIPGDLVGLHAVGHPGTPCGVLALTPVRYLDLGPSPALAPAPPPALLAAVAAFERDLIAHLVRLGQMRAEERLADILLETFERLRDRGLAGEGSLRLPLTQEMLADLLGLSAQHVNRVLRELARAGLLSRASGHVFLERPERLAQLAGRGRPTEASPVLA